MKHIERFVTIIIDVFDMSKERKAKMTWASLFIISFMRYMGKLDELYYIITILCLLGYYNIANYFVKKVYISNVKKIDNSVDKKNNIKVDNSVDKKVEA